MVSVYMVYAALGLLVPALCQDSPQLVILVADVGPSNLPGVIYRLNIHHMNLSALSIPNVLAPVAIQYDKDSRHIYWTDTFTKQVRKADIDGGNDVIVASLDSTSIPAGLTLDSNTNQLFYTDLGKKVIVRVEMNTFHSTVIVNTSLGKPRGIVADTRNRRLYWVDWGNDTIETCTYTGLQRRTFVSSGVPSPHGITIDEQEGRLFWTDGNGFIESMLVNGTDRKRLRTDIGTRYQDIAFFNDVVYYTISSDSGVYTLTKDGRYGSSLTSSRLKNPAGVYVFSPNVDVLVPCQYGQYGPTCAKCGKCSSGQPCEKTTGICLAGCASGYKEEMCLEVCDSGTFGDDCGSTCSPNCRTGAVCHHVTGHCPNGCEAGWMGNNCTIGMAYGRVQYYPWSVRYQPHRCGTRRMYGFSCTTKSNPCPPKTYGTCTPCGRCAGGVSCDTVSGNCTGGCQLGWTGSRCDLACASNSYGNCTPCGQCAGTTPCDVISGICPRGCQSGWKGIRCDSACASHTYGNCTPCGQCAGTTPCDVISGICPRGCQSGWKGNRCDSACASHTYGNCTPCGQCAGTTPCDVISGICPRGCQSGWKGNRCDSELPMGHRDNTGLTAGIAAGVTVVIIGVVVTTAVCLIKKHKKRHNDPYVEFNCKNKDSGDDGYSTLGNLSATKIFTLPRKDSTLGDVFG